MKKLISQLDNLKFKYYGNYGGPNYGSGKPVDELDRAFQRHDQAYDTGRKKTGDRDLWTERLLRGNTITNPFEGPATMAFAAKDMLGISEDAPPDPKRHVPSYTRKEEHYLPPKRAVAVEAAAPATADKGRTGTLTGNAVHALNGNIKPPSSQRYTRRAKPLQQAKQKRGTGGRQKLTLKLAPVNKSYGVRGSVPRIRSIKDGLEFSHSEQLSEIVSSGLAYNIAYNQSINPANPAMFPWLSTWSTAFEFYQFTALNFRYDPIVSTQSGGAVAIAFDYDVDDAAPTTLARMSTMSKYARDSCWTRVSSSPDLKKMLTGATPERLKYVSTSKTNDTQGGKVYVASSGCAAGTSGQLTVSYTIRLVVPQFGTTDVATSFAWRTVSNNPTTPSNIFGVTTTISGTSWIVDPLDRSSAIATIDGTWLVVVRVFGTSVANIGTTGSTAAITIIDGVTNAAGTLTLLTMLVTATAGQKVTLVLSGSYSISQSSSRWAPWPSTFGDPLPTMEDIVSQRVFARLKALSLTPSEFGDYKEAKAPQSPTITPPPSPPPLQASSDHEADESRKSSWSDIINPFLPRVEQKAAT